MVSKAVSLGNDIVGSLHVDYPSMDFHAFSSCVGFDLTSEFGLFCLQTAKRNFIEDNQGYLTELLNDDEAYHARVKLAVLNHKALGTGIKVDVVISVDAFIKVFCESVADNCAQEFLERLSEEELCPEAYS